MTLFETDDQFFSDLKSLIKEDRKLGAKVWELIEDILKNVHTPMSGIGKPEALKNKLSGFYSRRITDKHRLIYKVSGDKLYLVSCYGHYEDS